MPAKWGLRTLEQLSLDGLAMRSLLVAAALATLVGCAPSYGRHYHYGHHHHHSHRVSTGGALAVGLIAGVAIASLAHEPEPPPPPTAVYVYSSPPPVIVAAPAHRVDPAPADLPPLDPTATRNAFADVDFAGCNAPKIYGHAKITLNPDGRVSRVVVEDPADLDPGVAQCIGQRIGKVSVPPFRGGMVVLGTTFRVQ